MIGIQYILVIIILLIAFLYIVKKGIDAFKTIHDPCAGCAGCALHDQLMKKRGMKKDHRPHCYNKGK